jgi:putative pyruvate formate lyase activating enzyme
MYLSGIVPSNPLTFHAERAMMVSDRGEHAMPVAPSYITLYESGELERISSALENLATPCTICPHSCGTKRDVSAEGRCRSGLLPVVSSAGPHFGEEAPLVGRGGSGTVFFTNCNLSCIFCQNYDISHLGHGREVSCRELALTMMSLQERGCHNINFVTPTHMVPAIVRALMMAVPMGLHVPLVYNSGGYDSVSTLKLVRGVFDIYMPDFKYWDEAVSLDLSGVEDYPNVARRAVQEMHDQVGDLVLDERGIARRGLLVRHLVLPQGLAGTKHIVDFLRALSPETYLNLMDQYRPAYRARECPPLRRRTTLQEFDDEVAYARDRGMGRLDGVDSTLKIGGED